MSPERRPPDVDDEFLTVAEVAAILKLNQQTIRNWIDQSLPALRVGRRVRVLRRDLDQLLADAEESPGSSGAANSPPLTALDNTFDVKLPGNYQVFFGGRTN